LYGLNREIAELEFTIRNISQLSSIFCDSFANENDGKIITYENVPMREIFGKLEVTIDRLLYLVGCAALFIQSAWRNIYFFKYPRLAKLVFIGLALSFLFLDMNNSIHLVITVICFIIVYNNKIINAIVN
jgi:hypothetical protein